MLYQVTTNVLKFQTLLFFFSNKMLVNGAGTHKMLVSKANREYPDLTLIWVCHVCLGFCGREHLFEILNHLHKETYRS